MAIINNSFNFVFVHVPKAAGTSVTSILSKYTNYCDLEIGATEFGEYIQPAYKKRFGLAKHSPARDIRNLVGAVAWSKYFTFSFVRDPFERCYSTYNFLRKWESPNREFSSQMREFLTFEDYVKSDIWSRTNGPDDIFRPQAYWLARDMKTHELILDYVGRVENILDDMRHILNAVGLGKATEEVSDVPSLNRSTEVCHDWNVSADVIDRIVEKYRIDFELFGYSKTPCEFPNNT